mmetsp:Transcript_17572/g.51441  ORF Transcript_17572/g.51441 Transcript_17572/m.51441 type:complete len:265 (-) Transcript_17572:166-960(-)
MLFARELLHNKVSNIQNVGKLLLHVPSQSFEHVVLDLSKLLEGLGRHARDHVSRQLGHRTREGLSSDSLGHELHLRGHESAHYCRFQPSEDLLHIDEFGCDHVYYSPSHDPGFGRNNALPTKETKGILRKTPQRNASPFQRIEYHLHRQLVGHPTHERSDERDSKMSEGVITKPSSSKTQETWLGCHPCLSLIPTRHCPLVGTRHPVVLGCILCVPFLGVPWLATIGCQASHGGDWEGVTRCSTVHHPPAQRLHWRGTKRFTSS